MSKLKIYRGFTIQKYRINQYGEQVWIGDNNKGQYPTDGRRIFKGPVLYIKKQIRRHLGINKR